MFDINNSRIWQDSIQRWRSHHEGCAGKHASNPAWLSRRQAALSRTPTTYLVQYHPDAAGNGEQQCHPAARQPQGALAIGLDIVQRNVLPATHADLALPVPDSTQRSSVLWEHASINEHTHGLRPAAATCRPPIGHWCRQACNVQRAHGAGTDVESNVTLCN